MRKIHWPLNVLIRVSYGCFAIFGTTCLLCQSNDPGPINGIDIEWDSFWLTNMKSPQKAFEFSDRDSSIYAFEEPFSLYADSDGTTSVASIFTGSVNGFIYGGSSSQVIDGSVWMQLTGNAFAKMVYGGGSQAIAGDVNVYINNIITASTISTFYGGGSSVSGIIDGDVNVVFDSANTTIDEFCASGLSDVSGNVYIKLKSGTINSFHGAGGNIGGNINIEIDGSHEGENFYAGSESASATVSGMSVINMKNGLVDGTLYGAGLKGNVASGSEINISGGTIRYGVMGAGGNNAWNSDPKGYVGEFDENNNVTMVANATINISGGTILGNDQHICGAGFGTDFESVTANGKDGAVTGNTYINITGGSIGSGDELLIVMGGGIGSTVHGSANIFVDTSVNQVTFNNVEIQASGEVLTGDNEFDGTVKGDASVTFVGDGNKLIVQGEDSLICGDRYRFQKDGKDVGRVWGDTVFNFGKDGVAFNHGFDFEVIFFDNVNVGNGSRVLLNVGISFVSKELKIETGSSLVLNGKDTFLENVAASQIVGVIGGVGNISDSIITGNGGRVEVARASQYDGSMSWDNCTFENIDIVFDVLSVLDYSQVSLDSLSLANTINFNDVRFIINSSEGFDFESLIEGNRFYLFTGMDSDMTHLIDNGSQFILPELEGDLYWDYSKLYTEGFIAVIPEPQTYVAFLGTFVLIMTVGCRRKYLSKDNANRIKSHSGHSEI